MISVWMDFLILNNRAGTLPFQKERMKKMFRYYVRMKKGRKEISGECYTKSLILDYIKQQEKEGYKVIETNFEM